MNKLEFSAASAWGCASRIRRFIDPDAEFLFISVRNDPLPDSAEPFDIPGARLSHRRGHASFGTFLEEYRLKDPVRVRIARMIDEVDTTQEALAEPAAPGLDLICDGIQKLSRDDHDAAIERGRLVCGALYAQLAAEAAV